MWNPVPSGIGAESNGEESHPFAEERDVSAGRAEAVARSHPGRGWRTS